MIKGVIFDFNGTLFWDSQLHIDAWKDYSAKIRAVPFTEEEMLQHMFGRTNADIIEYATGKKPSKELLEKIASEKEAYYRDMCLKRPDEFHLAPCAVEFLDYLKANQIPMTIATMSEWCNVEFYIKEFNLAKWFDLEKIVYSDGSMSGKPAPDIYLRAAKNLGLHPKDCLVVEDALSGIKSAQDAGIGNIIAIASREPIDFYKNLDCLSQIITDFNQIDKSLFKIKNNIF